MNTFLELLNRNNFQSRIQLLSKKYKNKKILIYGTGKFCDAIFDNFDLSSLNIIAVSDKKYLSDNQYYKGIKAIPPENILEQNPDVILIAVYTSCIVEDFLSNILFKDSKKIHYESIFSGFFALPYDAIFSIGEVCFSATALKLYNLRKFSGPFDWLSGSSFQWRIQLLLNQFEGFFEIEDLQYQSSISGPNESVDVYESKKTGIVFSHDFAYNTPFDESYPLVKEKYDRRTSRMLNYLKSDNNILLVYMETPGSMSNPKSDIEIIEAVRALNDKFEANIYLLYIVHNENYNDRECFYKELAGNVVKAEIFNRDITKEVSYTGNFDNIGLVFKHIGLI